MNIRSDMRRQRAAAFTAMVLGIVRAHVRDREVLRDITYEIEELCIREGVEVITDRMRADMGLPARGPDGWTIEEYLAIEQRRLDVMRAPVHPSVYICCGYCAAVFDNEDLRRRHLEAAHSVIAPRT